MRHAPSALARTPTGLIGMLQVPLAKAISLATVLLFGLATGTFGSAGLSAQEPNVLVFLADDLGVEQLELYGLGSDYPNTPTIDALAAGGTVFRRAWSYAVCTPTRATLQSGRHGFRTGVGQLLQFVGPGLPADEFILPEMLDAGAAAGGASYAHGLFGKWHLGNASNGGEQSVNLAGWDHFEGTNHTGFLSYYEWEKNTNGTSAPNSNYITSETADDTLNWIGQQTSPWVAFVSFHAPHAPYHAPPAHLHSVDFGHSGTPQETPRPYFLAMIEAMDTEMARVLAGIGDEIDNTVVIFLADNGTQDVVTIPPYSPAKVKSTLYEGGIHVPLIVNGPGVAAGGSSDALVSTVDLFATVADLAGVDLSAVQPSDHELDSVSLMPYLAQPSSPSQRSHLYAEGFVPNGPGSPFIHDQAATDGRYKLITRTDSAQDELYDLQRDPLELNNLLLGSPTQEEVEAYSDLPGYINELVSPWPASVHTYGCGVNPEGSLTFVSGEPTIGSTLSVEIDNPFGASTPGDLSLLLIAITPPASYPCGALVPGFGLAGNGAVGEKLVAFVGAVVLAGSPWAPGQPGLLNLGVPNNPQLNGAPIYFQGALLGDSHSPVPVGLTQALKVQIGL